MGFGYLSFQIAGNSKSCPRQYLKLFTNIKPFTFHNSSGRYYHPFKFEATLALKVK